LWRFIVDEAGLRSGSKRRDAREAEGAPLLREYRVKSSIEGSNPSLSAIPARDCFAGRTYRSNRRMSLEDVFAEPSIVDRTVDENAALAHTFASSRP
jgi:hypothetical protein